MELFAVQQCSREIPFALLYHSSVIGLKAEKRRSSTHSKKQTLSLSLKILKMLKFVIALLFFQVLLASPVFRKSQYSANAVQLNASLQKRTTNEAIAGTTINRASVFRRQFFGSTADETPSLMNTLFKPLTESGSTVSNGIGGLTINDFMQNYSPDSPEGQILQTLVK